jgi:predicted RNase H-like nuclease (RuvC/YqgF family)
MSSVVTEDFEQIIRALQDYIEEMSRCTEDMKRAAAECNDNMGSDEIGRKTLEKVNDCAVKLNNSIDDAADLEKRLSHKLNQILCDLNQYGYKGGN